MIFYALLVLLIFLSVFYFFYNFWYLFPFFFTCHIFQRFLIVFPFVVRFKKLSVTLDYRASSVGITDELEGI
jgi:hypothetical protein